MGRPPSRYPTELELTILKLLWREGPMPALRLRDLLADEAEHDIAVTSVITTMNTMVDKGYLSRQRDGRAFVYTAEVEEDAVSKGILRDVVDRVFDGSASALMLHLIEDRNITASERRELEAMVERLSQKSPGSPPGSPPGSSPGSSPGRVAGSGKTRGKTRGKKKRAGVKRKKGGDR